MTMDQECEEPLTQDDRDVLSHMLFPLFEDAVRQKGNVTRDQIRLDLGKFFPWPHIVEVLKAFEDLDYIDQLSTRGGGMYIPGEKYGQWAGEISPATASEPESPSGGQENLVLSRDEAEALVTLVRELAAPTPGERALKKAHAALTEKAAADIIKKLVD